ncbi:MAG TPA: DUF2784 domain-containing protein [Mucilaginibacter sp.]|jgi:hypothetical protein|nr:DUF2784 domain-containing protein [Mucilaginibacter sp.]
MGLKALDLFLTLLHFVIIGFNLLGWIWQPLRKVHLICVAITAGCWFIVGIWYGIGYCPITDWEWHVKTQLGETNLPNSFIKYYADKISGTSVSASLIDMSISVCFGAAMLLSVYFNFFAKRFKRTR